MHERAGARSGGIGVALMLLAIACSSSERPKAASSTADGDAGAMVADASEPPAQEGDSGVDDGQDAGGDYHTHWSFSSASECTAWMAGGDSVTNFSSAPGADGKQGFCYLCTASTGSDTMPFWTNGGYGALPPGKYAFTGYIMNGTPAAATASLTVLMQDPPAPDAVAPVTLTASWTKAVVTFEIPPTGEAIVPEVTKDGAPSTCIGVDELDFTRISD